MYKALKKGISYLVFFSVLTGCNNGNSQISLGNLQFYPIEDIREFPPLPGAGAEQWHDQNIVQIPYGDSSQKPLDKYYRFTWAQFEKAENEFDWSDFDREINDAIDHQQKFSFGIMSVCPPCVNEPMGRLIDGAGAAYPLYLHQKMQAESVQDWVSTESNVWVPNWNSPVYRNRWRTFLKALAEHLKSGSYKNQRYQHAIRYIDIRGYGNYGEWHHAALIDDVSHLPPGLQAQTESLRDIINAHLEAFADYQLVVPINALDGNQLRNTRIPEEIGHYLLTAKTRAGLLGIRRDNWGSTARYLEMYMNDHPVVYNNLSFKEQIKERWKFAPIVGEPTREIAAFDGKILGDLPSQILRQHANSFGNGNLIDPQNPETVKAIVNAAKLAGYRISLKAASVPLQLNRGDSCQVTVYFQNLGNSPPYEHWTASLLLSPLRSDSIVLKTKMPFDPYLFLPAREPMAVTTNFEIPASVIPGDYNLMLVVEDSIGYRSPMPLLIKGRPKNGAYSLCTITIE